MAQKKILSIDTQNQLIHFGQEANSTWKHIIHGDVIHSSSLGGYLKSDNYSPTIMGGGWAIYNTTQSNVCSSNIQVDNLRVRNTLYAHIFQKDIVRASNGYLFISDCGQIQHDVNIAQTGTQYIITVKQDTFINGDMLWYKSYSDAQGLDIRGFKGRITSGSTSTESNGHTLYQYGFTSDSGTGSMKAGGTIVRVGNTSSLERQGSFFFDASSTNAPFMDIYDGVSSWGTGSNTGSLSFSDPSKIKLRIGKLEGLGTFPASGNTISGYGLYTDNAYLKGQIEATGGLIGGWSIQTGGITSGNITMSSGVNPYIKLGTLSGTSSSTTNRGIFLSGSGDILIKGSGSSTNYIKFDNNGLQIKTTNFTVNTNGGVTASNALLSGKITATSGAIGGWDIGSDSIYKNNTKLSSISSSYIQNNTLPSPSITLTCSSFIGTYPIKSDTVQYKTITIKSGSTTQTIAVGQQVSVIFAYEIPSLSKQTVCDVFLTLYYEGQSTYQKNYKLIGGQTKKLNVSIKNVHTGSRNIKYKIVGVQAPPKDSTIYDTLTISQFGIYKYTPSVQLSANGMMIFNSPSKYIKMGYISQSAGYYTGVSQFKGSSIQVDNLTVYNGIYNYGLTFVAGNNLLGTTANKFTINTDGTNENSQLIFNKNNVLSKVTFDGADVIFDDDIKVGSSYVVKQSRTLKLTSSNNSISIDTQSAVDLTRNRTWVINHATITTSSPTNANSSNKFLNGLTISNGHITAYTTGSVDLSHTHQIKLTGSNAFVMGIGQGINFDKSGLITLVTDNTNKKITIGTNIKTLTISNGLTGTSYNGSTATTIGHGSATGTLTSTASDSAQVISGLTRDTYGHLTGNSVVNVHDFTTTSHPLTQSITNSLKTLSLNYNSSNLKLTSNALNTIQDITTASNVMFRTITLKNGSYSGSLSILNNTNSSIVSDRSMQVKSFIQIDNSDNSKQFQWKVDGNNISLIVL